MVVCCVLSSTSIPNVSPPLTNPSNRDRVKGFPCPRGTSIHTAFERPCKGKVDNTRVYHPKGPKKQAKPAKQAPPPPRPAKPTAPPKARAQAQADPLRDIPFKAKLELPVHKPQPRKVFFDEAYPPAAPVVAARVKVAASVDSPAVERDGGMSKAQKKNAKRLVSKHAAAAAAAANPYVNTGKHATQSDINGCVRDNAAKELPGPIGPTSMAATSAWVVDLEKYNRLLGGALGAADSPEEQISLESGLHQEDAAAVRDRSRSRPFYLNPQELNALKNDALDGRRGRPPVVPAFNGSKLGAALMAAKQQAGWALPEAIIEGDPEDEGEGEGEEDLDDLLGFCNS